MPSPAAAKADVSIRKPGSRAKVSLTFSLTASVPRAQQRASTRDRAALLKHLLHSRPASHLTVVPKALKH